MHIHWQLFLSKINTFSAIDIGFNNERLVAFGAIMILMSVLFIGIKKLLIIRVDEITVIFSISG